ncbi:protein kinase domain-containing protein [Aliivibrio wodanis]|uniref:protein kinase domain-containing protein n=1 Tax=Aliivibrio wodanis TaxID=80852 RepID=UPI00406C1260
MPLQLAKSFDEYKQKVKDLDIVDDFVILGETLRELHSRNIAHRDIKPENLLHLDERLVFTDFGLVKYPERESLTPIKRDVGAKFTMAPEMRRFASKADGKAADVYSFAKSLWIALSGEARGFDGQYIPNGILGLKNYHKDLYLKSLDDLLVIATDNDPDVRPSIHEFLVELDTWLTLNRNFEQRNLREWFEIQSSLFPLGSPEQASWTNSDSIIMVIKELSKSKSPESYVFS